MNIAKHMADALERDLGLSAGIKYAEALAQRVARSHPQSAAEYLDAAEILRIRLPEISVPTSLDERERVARNITRTIKRQEYLLKKPAREPAWDTVDSSPITLRDIFAAFPK